MAREALPPVADKMWLFRFLLQQCKKAPAELRICRGNLDDVAELNVANVGVVIEVDRPRSARSNLALLKTGL